MRKIMVAVLALAALLAGCTATGGETAGEPTLESAPDTESAPALNPVTPTGGDELPTGYPELDSVPPSGTVDLGNLTPEANENTTPRVMPSPGRPGLTGSPQLGVLLEAVSMNLSAEIGAPLDEIAVVSNEPMSWPNTALGCPEEGIAYAEVIVEGLVITLEAAGQQYTYHTDGGSNFVLCQDGEPIATGVVPRR